MLLIIGKNDGGYGIVGWHAHGNYDAAARQIWDSDDGDEIPERPEMDWPNFISYLDAPNLDSNHSSIVFSASCLNSYPENSNNLSANLLRYASAGLVGSTRISWYTVGWDSPNKGGNASIEYYFFKKFIDEKYSIGKSLFLGKNEVPQVWGSSWIWEYYANMYDFNLYGDPSLNLVTQLQPPLITSTSLLPNGTQNQSYSYTFSATGGTSPYTWSKVFGSFPSGLSLSSSGNLSGVPTESGTFNFRIRVTDSGGRTDEKDFTLTINPVQTLETFIFSTISSPQYKNENIYISIQAVDINGDIVTGFNGEVTLSSTAGSISYPSPAKVNFVGGMWSGNVNINDEGQNIRIQATYSSKTGFSDPFTILPFSQLVFEPIISSPQYVDVTISITVKAKTPSGKPGTWSGTLSLSCLL